MLVAIKSYCAEICSSTHHQRSRSKMKTEESEDSISRTHLEIDLGQSAVGTMLCFPVTCNNEKTIYT